MASEKSAQNAILEAAELLAAKAGEATHHGVSLKWAAAVNQLGRGARLARARTPAPRGQPDDRRLTVATPRSRLPRDRGVRSCAG